jgi:hypothetical protein
VSLNTNFLTKAIEMTNLAKGKTLIEELCEASGSSLGQVVMELVKANGDKTRALEQLNKPKN